MRPVWPHLRTFLSSGSFEFLPTMTAATAQTVQYLNLAYFGRPADPASQAAFPTTGMTDEEIVLSFVKTSEYQSNTVIPSSVADSPVVAPSISPVLSIPSIASFGRNAATAVAGWSNAIGSGAVNYDYLGITILRAGLNLPAGTQCAMSSSPNMIQLRLSAISSPLIPRRQLRIQQTLLSPKHSLTSRQSPPLPQHLPPLDATVSAITSPVTAGSKFVLT